MKLEHVAIWTNQLEVLKNFYVKYFDGVPNKKYTNHKRGFSSYFITFNEGARLEIMQMARVPGNKNDTIHHQHLGIIHLAFGLETPAAVDRKAEEFKRAGFTILKGPRKTGDGYYEFETLDPDNNRLEITSICQES
ncbi:MAG TPA: VOC family protein [Cyclobacteriaceae bacterium]